MAASNKPKLSHNKDFILLFLGGFVSRVGNGVHNIALVWYVLELTGSGTATGALLLLATLPGVLIGPLGGVTADRINRKLLIVSMDVVRGIIVIALAWTLYAGIATFVYLAAATVLLAVSSSFFNPAVTATIPNLVDDRNLQQANSLNHFSMNLTQIIGFALGGVLIGLVGVTGVFLVDGITFLLSAASELFIDIPAVKQVAGNESRVAFFADLKVGIRYLYDTKVLLILVSVAFLMNFLFNGLIAVGLPYVFKEILGVSSTHYGIAQAMWPVGAVIGALALSILPEVKKYFLVLITALSLQSLLLACLGIPMLPAALSTFPVFTIYLLMITVLLASGTVNAVLNVPLMVVVQRLVPDELRGRIFGLMGTVMQGLTPISMGLMGLLIDRMAPHYLFIISGSLALVMTFIASRIKIFREFDTPPKAEGCQAT